MTAIRRPGGTAMTIGSTESTNQWYNVSIAQRENGTCALTQNPASISSLVGVTSMNNSLPHAGGFAIPAPLSDSLNSHPASCAPQTCEVLL